MSENTATERPSTEAQVSAQNNQAEIKAEVKPTPGLPASSDFVRVAILGMTEAGEAFAENLLEKIQLEQRPIRIVAVADPNPDHPVMLGFQYNDTAVFTDYLDVAKMADDIDIIFDMTNDRLITQKLRLELLEHKNRHTTIASQQVARLVWLFFGEEKDLPTAIKTKTKG